MSETDTMRLVAEVVDKYSGPLKDMNKSLRDLANVAKGSHEKAGTSAREHAKHMRELHERISKTKEFVAGAMTPALATMGITAFGLGEGLAKITESLKKTGEQYNVFSDIAKRSGQRFEDIDGWSLAFQRLGVNAERTGPALSDFGEHMDKLRRRQPEEMSNWAHAFGDGLQFIAGKIAGLHGRKEQLEAILDAFDKHPEISVDKRRKFYEQFGLPPEFATKTGKEIREAIEGGFAVSRAHPVSKELMHGLDDSFTHLREAMFGFNQDMVETFGPKGVKVVDGFATAIERVGKMLKDMHGPKAEVPFDKRSIFGRIAEGMGFTANGGALQGGADDRKTESTIAKGTQKGFLDALREFEASHRTPANSFAGGYTPMAYHPEGGGAGGGRGWGGGGYRQLLEGSGGGAGGSGSGGDGSAPRSMGAGGGSSPMGDALRRKLGMGGGGSAGGGSDPGAGLKGSEYLKAHRQQFADAMKQNPQLRKQIAGMMALEGERDPVPVVESLMNRAEYTGKSLSKLLHSGFYGPLNRGQLPGMMAKLEHNPKRMARMNAAIDAALNGSNIIKGATDQGMPSDPNGRWPGGWMKRGGNVFNDWGGGPGGHEGARRFREAQQRAVTEAATFARNGASLRDHIRHHGSALNNARKSGVLGGPSSGAGQATNHNLQIDFNNMPKGTRTAYRGEGLFKEVRLNRGRAMPMASQDS